jgi:hypothetical protein
MGRSLLKMQLLKTHEEFEARCLTMKESRRSIVKSCRGVPQHVVENGTAILCWPVSYGLAVAPVAPTVRYVSLYDGLECGRTVSPCLTTEVLTTPSRPLVSKAVLLEEHAVEDGVSTQRWPVSYGSVTQKYVAPTVRYESLYEGLDFGRTVSPTDCLNPRLG